MKKLLVLLLALITVFSFIACEKEEENGDGNDDGTNEGGQQGGNEGGTEGGSEGGEEPAEPTGVMTYEEYMAADIDDKVIIEAYVQAHQNWWDNKITVYLQDQDGAYFAYELACSEEDAAKLLPGTKIKITGYKAAWAGEVEIVDGTFEFVEDADTWIAPATNVTSLLGTDELINHQNKFVKFFKMTVKAIAYKNDTPGDDIYVTLTRDGEDYSFCVERYLTGPDTAVYAAVGELEAGDVIDVEGFLYWYEGVNTHITAVYPHAPMTYAEYDATFLDSEVEIEAYVQATQSWWSNKITVYLQDEDGAYFAYELACSEEDAAKLLPGTKIRITGYKAAWAGEVEIVDGTFEFVEDADTWIAPATNVTSLLGTDELINHQNKFVKFFKMTVKAIEYKNDTPGDDIYVTLTKDGEDYSFCVEKYLTGPDTAVYAAVGALEAGDVIDVEGFLYWYEGVNTHITAVYPHAPMTYAEYDATFLDSEVEIEAYVQATQSWWSNKITVYLQDEDGAYFAYELACSEEDAAKLLPGTKIRITGYKAAWAGEVEIVDGTFEFVEDADTWIAPATDVTALLGTDELIKHQNKFVKFTDMTVKAIEYKNDTPGDDIYVTLTKGENDYSFCVERYLTGPDTAVYAAVGALEAGDVIDVEGFLYWYEGVNTHITAVVAK